MAVSIVLFQLDIGGRTIAFDSGDISFGQGETRDLAFNRNGKISTVTVAKAQVTLTIRGGTSADLAAVEAERENNIDALIAGTEVTQNIDIGGKMIGNALLKQVNPSGPITIQGTTNFETIELVYESADYS